MKKHIIISLRVGLTIPFVFFGTIIIASLFYPGYSQSRQYVSELGAGFAPHPWIFNTGLTLRGATEVIAAFGFLCTFRKLKLPPILGALAAATMCVSGFAALISAHYPFPSPRHYAYGLQVCLVVAPLLFAGTLRKLAGSKRLIIFLLINNAILLIAYLLSMGVGGFITPQNVGLIQRFRILVSFPWLSICACWLLQYIKTMPPPDSALEPTGTAASVGTMI
jgi:hypothetical membrane protein